MLPLLFHYCNYSVLYFQLLIKKKIKHKFVIKTKQNHAALFHLVWEKLELFKKLKMERTERFSSPALPLQLLLLNDRLTL